MVYTQDQQKRDLIASIKAEDDPIKKLQLLGNLVKVAARDDIETISFLKTLAASDPSTAVQNFAAKCSEAFAPPAASGSGQKMSSSHAAERPGPGSVENESLKSPEDSLPPISDERMRRLVDLLNHDESAYRLKAVKAVEQVNLVEALPHMIKALRIESSLTVIEEMLSAIGSIDKERKHFNDILPYLRNETPQIRLAAIDALTHYEDKRKYRLLITLSDDEDDKVKGAVIKSFAHLTKEELISELKTMGEVGNLPMKLSVLSFVSHLSWSELNGLLVNMAADTDPHVREKAIETIAKRGDSLFLELISAWIPAAAVPDLQLLSNNLAAYDSATKGKRSTDVQILRSRLKRIIEGDNAARNIDIVLSVIKDEESVHSSGPSHAQVAAAEKYKKKASFPKKNVSKPVEPAYVARKGKLTDEGLLGKLNFLTKIVFFLKIAAVVSLFYLGYHHLSPWVEAYMEEAKNMRIASDFKTIAQSIKRYEVSGKKFVGSTSDDLVNQGVLQSCQDPWAQPYRLSTYFQSIKSLGADRSEPVTAPVLLTQAGTLEKSDDVIHYYGTRKPDAMWITVSAPDGPMIFKVSIDGGASVDITNMKRPVLFKPSISPDGLKMAWLSSETSGFAASDTFKVYIGDCDGSGGVPVSASGTSFSPVNWSKDSSRVIYSYKSSEFGGLSKVNVYNLNTQETRTYFKDMPDNDYNPAFSEKDDTIFFARHLPGDDSSIKQYRDGWVATKDPFDRTINGDHPFIASNGTLYFFRGDEGNEQLYLIRGRSSNEEIYNEALRMLPPVYVSASGKTVVYTRRSDYGYVVSVRRADVARKGEVTYTEYPIFGSPWPIASLTRQSQGSFFDDVTSSTDDTSGDDYGTSDPQGYDTDDSSPSTDEGNNNSGTSSSSTDGDGDIDI